MSNLSVMDVSVDYGSARALDRVSLEVGSGEVVAVIGPSGCGKSSLLRAIAGLEPLSTGSVALGGKNLAGVPTHERDLGLMFQEHALFPHLSVGANVAFGLRMQRLDRASQSERAEELLDLVGLAGFGDRRVDALSGGEAQRVALARALAPSPRLLMLDEPLGSLDRLLRQQLVAELRSVFVGLGVTALHVTHDQAEAFALADRVVVLRDGEVVQSGRPAAVWRAPNSTFVARFLGHPNLWQLAGESVLVPVPAIRSLRVIEDTAGDLGWAAERSVVVDRVEFREGRFRVTAQSTTPVLCGLDVGPVTVVFDMEEEPKIGGRVLIQMDHDQMVVF